MSWVNNSQTTVFVQVQIGVFKLKSFAEFEEESIFLLGSIKEIDRTCLHHLTIINTKHTQKFINFAKFFIYNPYLLHKRKSYSLSNYSFNISLYLKANK